MQFDHWRGLRAIFLSVAGAALLFPGGARADTKDELVGSQGASLPLQKVLAKERKRGPIFVAIPGAYVFGLGRENARTYCSPTVRATNSSNLPVEELILGMDYHNSAGSIGGSVTRYANIKVGQQDSHYFYQLSVSDCRGIEGTVTVVRCVYSSGEDCSADVQVIDFGTIPLQLKDQRTDAQPRKAVRPAKGQTPGANGR